MFAQLPSLTLSPAAVQEAGRILANRRRQGVAGPVLPASCRPVSLDDALAIQGATARYMDDAIAGWKCGSPGDGKLVLAPIYAGSICCHAHTCPVWAEAGQVRVEPELAFLMRHDLPVRAQAWQPHEVDEAIGATHLALELIDSRYRSSDGADPALHFADKLADDLVNQGLYIGPQTDGAVAPSAGEMEIGVRVGDQPEVVCLGRHPDSWPRQPLYWLAEFLRQQGLGLSAGQWVITGSYAGTLSVPVAQTVGVRHGGLGHFTVCFQPR